MKFLAVVMVALVPLVFGGSLMEELALLNDTTIIRDLLNATGLDAVVDSGYYTLFAPSDAAFAALPDEAAKTILGNATILSAVLTFHATQGIFRSMDAANNMKLKSVLAGSDIRVNVYNDVADGSLFVTLNGAKVTKANIQATNGYLHVIDRVMLPPMGSMYDLVAASEVHTLLKALIDEQKLEDFFRTVTGTLFAPTDAAFQVLGEALAAKGITVKNSVAEREILMYHLLEQVVYSAGGHAGTYNTFDQGNQVTVSMVNSTVMINQALVVIGDLSATNGVLHVIDSVLVPEPWATALIVG